MFRNIIDSIVYTVKMAWANAGLGNNFQSGLDWAFRELHNGASVPDLEASVLHCKGFHMTEADKDYSRGVLAACEYYGGGL